MDNFPYAIAALLRAEGGYVNNPNDAGGETNFGISKAAYPNVDIRNLTRQGASQIYYQDYWLKNHLDAIIHPEVASAALDTVVNHGAGPKILQAALASTKYPVTTDGVIGPQTLAAINAATPSDYLTALYNARKSYYEHLATDPKNAGFLKGWLARIDKWNVGTTLEVTGGSVMLLALFAAAYYFYKRTQS